MIALIPSTTVESAPLAPASLTSTDGAQSLPLVGVRCDLHVTGLDHEITVVQRFANALDTPIEALYVFPLPPAAAVVEMVARFGDRTVRARLDRRDAARAAYATAIAAGHQAALLEEDRPSTFTMTVGNIPAGADVEVRIVVVGQLELVAGAPGTSALLARLRLPTTVAPRYTTGTPLAGPSAGDGVDVDTDSVPDASRVTPPIALDHELAPTWAWRASFDAAGLPVTAVRCTSHAVATAQDDQQLVLIHDASVADRDVAFEIELAADAVVAGARWSIDGAGQAWAALPGHATAIVTVVPPAGLAPVRIGRDVAVLVDRSGSMEGWKMTAAAAATSTLIGALDPDDRIAVATFDSSLDPLTPGLVPVGANRAAIARSLSLVTARGGTEMGPALSWATAVLAASAGRRRIVVIVSDAEVSGEDAMLRALGGDDGRPLPRLLLLGVDAAANLGLLHRLAARSGGATEIADAPGALDAAVARLATFLGDPVIDDLGVELPGGTTMLGHAVVAPGVLPPAFAGQPLRIAVRADAPAPITLHGRLHDGTRWTHQLAVHVADGPGPRWAWGRARVRDLEDGWAAGDDVSLDEIVDVALACGVLCRHTAFVAVDHEGPTGTGDPVMIVQPVALPAGWAPQQGGAMLLAAHQSHPAPAMAPMVARPTTAAPAKMDAAAFDVVTGGQLEERAAPRGRTGAAGSEAGAGGSVGAGFGAVRRRLAPALRKVAAPARRSPVSELDRLLAELDEALRSDPAATPTESDRRRWTRSLRALARSAAAAGGRSQYAVALDALADAVQAWDAAGAEPVRVALAAVRAEVSA